MGNVNHFVRIFAVFFAWGLILASCSGSRMPKPEHENLIIYPTPPDPARIQFLTSINTSHDVAGRPSFFQRYILGEEREKSILKPYGVTIKNSKLYICDTMLPGLEIIDLENNQFTYLIPSGLGQLKKPINCDVDDQGQIYIADAARRQVVITDQTGQFISAIGDGQHGKPTDIKVYDNKLFICDLDAHQIRVFDQSGKNELLTFPDTAKNRPQYLYSPTNIAVHKNKVYVTDTGDARVKIFTTAGEYIGHAGEFGKRPGQFARPKGIAVDDSGLLYVADASFENIQIFDNQSDILMYFGDNRSQPGCLWLPAGLAIDYNSIDYFKKYIHPGFEIEYLIFAISQFGPAKINIYGFIKTQEEN